MVGGGWVSSRFNCYHQWDKMSDSKPRMDHQTVGLLEHQKSPDLGNMKIIQDCYCVSEFVNEKKSAKTMNKTI